MNFSLSTKRLIWTLPILLVMLSGCRLVDGPLSLFESDWETELKRADYLTPLEKQVVVEMNYARTNPKRYARFLEEIKASYRGKSLILPNRPILQMQEDVTAVDEAIAFLKMQKPVGPLSISEGLSRAASDHVRDQGETGHLGHYGRDGSTASQRIERYGEWQGAMAENIHYGENEARLIVMMLIVDDGVPDRSHRLTMFESRFKLTGVACGSHPVFRHMCVITYAAGFEPRPERL